MLFEDFFIWREARSIYNLLCKRFFQKSFRDYTFRDQIIRAALSIGNNIAEGYERKTNNEWIYFLYVAKGSCGEVRSMVQRGEDNNYFTADEREQLVNRLSKLGVSIYNLIKSKR